MSFYYQLITPDGVTFDLDPSRYSVSVEFAEGTGLPPIKHTTQQVFNQPGALLKGIQIQPRMVTILSTIHGDCRMELHEIRAALWQALRWNRTTDDPPAYATLRYNCDGQAADLHVYYLADAWGSRPGADTAGDSSIRLVAYDPAWYSTTDIDVSLLMNVTTNVSYIAGRIDGFWDDMNNAGTGTVKAIAPTADGAYAYVGGNFTNWGGIAAADYITRFNRSNGLWAVLGTGMDGIVNALAIGPDGTLYAGGTFEHAGGVDVNCIAKWNGVAWSALGTGLDGAIGAISVDALAFGSDGTLYVAGLFNSVSGVASVGVAKWNGLAWAAMGTGLANGSAAPRGLALVADTSNGVYVGGCFTSANAVPAQGVARWNGTTFTALGSGVGTATQNANALALGTDGQLYAGGNFTASGSLTVNYIARWNGTAWFAMAGGANATVDALKFDSDGTLLAGGFFTTIGGITLADRVARWDGTSWSQLDLNLPGTPSVYAIALSSLGDLYLGFDTFGAATWSGPTTIEYDGDMLYFPIIVAEGPGTLVWIGNYADERKMVFNCYINAGETITIDLSPGAKTIISDWRGNMFPYTPILPVSDFATFCLEPDPIAAGGSNGLNIYIKGTTADSAITLTYRNAYLSLDKAISG